METKAAKEANINIAEAKSEELEQLLDTAAGNKDWGRAKTIAEELARRDASRGIQDTLPLHERIKEYAAIVAQRERAANAA